MTEITECSCMQEIAGLQCKAGARLELSLHTNSCCTSEKAASAHSCICTTGDVAPAGGVSGTRLNIPGIAATI